jgi:hypothetical protein
MDAPPCQWIYIYNGKIGSLLNKDSSPVTNAHENSSIEAPTLNIFYSNSSPTTLIVTTTTNALTVVGFNRSK